MWIASVPAAAPVVPGAAPAAPPAAGDAAFGDALDASLLDEQAPAAPAAGASSPAVFDQRALAAWLLTGTPVTTTSDAMSDVEAAPSETEPSADEDLDDAADAPEIAVDPMLVAPVATAQQPVDASTVQIPEAAAERPAEGNGQLMPAVPAPDRASGQDAASAQYGAGESAMTETAEAAPEHAGKAAEPQHLVRPKPEAAVKKDEAAVTSATPQGTESAEGTLTELGGHPGSAARPASHDVTKPVAMRAGAAATHAAAHAPAQAVAAVAESSAAEAAAPAAETANATSIAGQRGERETRDTTIGFARVPVGPAAAQAQAQAQMGGGDAQSFEQDARRSPAAQRLAAALSMTAPSGAHESANGPAPVFSLPGQPAVAPAPIAAPVAVVPAAPTEVDAENVQTLVQAMRVTAKAGGWEATVRLKPEHLGEVTIALRVDGKNVSAIVQAESAGVRQWLMSQEDAVRSGMSEHGLQLDRFTVSKDGQRREAEEQQPQQQRRRPRENGQATQRFEIVV